MDASMLVQNQPLVTKFFVPTSSGRLISRPRLMALLVESLKYPLTLVSAPAGFGKTMLLSAWVQSLPANHPLVAWVSLDEEDNEPRLFWIYVLTALNRQRPECFTSLLRELQSPQAPSLKYILTMLINLLVEETDTFVLILDDYQEIKEEQVHTTLAYLIEHLPPQLRIIVATRADPPLPLPLLRAGKQALEVRTDQLRCTPEETKAFFHEVIGIQLPEETIQQVTGRIEGWLVGLQLLRLSLPEQADPLRLLTEASGDQCYILDYLTQEVLQRQPQEVQTFLLYTCILEQLTASLCDAVVEQCGSQQMLQQLEQANVFVVSLDSKRQWYRYHALFAQALRYQLEQRHADKVPILRHRASNWYAEHNQLTQAILHALGAKEWQWAADLIERKHHGLFLFNWGASLHALALLRELIEQLPVEVVGSRPRLCLACVRLLWQIAPKPILQVRLEATKAMLTASLTMSTDMDVSHPTLDLQTRQEQENQLGEVFALCAFLQSFQENAEAVFPLCQRALTLLSADNLVTRTYLAYMQQWVYYISSLNDAVACVESGLQAISLAQATEQAAFIIATMGSAAGYMVIAGRFHEAERLVSQAMELGRKSGRPILPDVGWPMVWQAEILRERNELDAALSLVEEAIAQCQQTEVIVSLSYLSQGYAILLRICLSRGELEAAYSALQQHEHIGLNLNQSAYSFYCSFFTTVDQARLWLACGELDRATHWAEELKLGERHGTPFAHEREEVARARILLATAQPTPALQWLEPVRQRATAGKRWGHVIEARLLQALAYQMCQEETQALDALSEAVCLAEPEGYIRSFVDEGASMEALLYRLRKRTRKQGPTPYLDTVIEAFQQESKAHVPTKAHQLLSQRELEVLQLLARGVSNLEIAQELVIVVDTVKRHVSNIFSKLGVQNRVQAVKQARECGLLID